MFSILLSGKVSCLFLEWTLPTLVEALFWQKVKLKLLCARIAEPDSQHNGIELDALYWQRVKLNYNVTG